MAGYRYWVKSVSVTGVESNPTTSVTGTPSAATGNYIDYRFKRAASAPSTPTGSSPSGWYDAPPADDGHPVWLVKAIKKADGTLVGTWSTPSS